MNSLTKVIGVVPSAVTEPFFSVVIPCYNAAQYLRETLESVLAQRYVNFEIIVVDDGSTDDSPRILNEYALEDPRVRVVTRAVKSGGPATPRNEGIASSRGTYVALLDADDLWTPDKLLNDFNQLSERPVDILYSGAYYFEESPANVVHTSPVRRMGPLYLLRNHIPTFTLCIRRAAFSTAQVFDQDACLVAIEDYHFLLNAYLTGKTFYGRQQVDGYYRKNSQTSIYSRHNFGLLIRRHIYNLAKLAMKQSIDPWRLIMLINAQVGYFCLKKLIGRL